MGNKTLTIVLCQTREGNYTFSSLASKVLTSLESDLAFCGSASHNPDDLILKNSKYCWNFSEPADWSEAADSISSDSGNWRELVKLCKNFLGGSGLHQSIGSGLIIMYWREILRRELNEEILQSYDWFVITRSDFLWQIEHPNVDLLNPERIYLLDGEKYGGISDRHIVFHRKHADKVLSFAAPIFHDALNIKERLVEKSFSDINPEKYLAFIAEEYGISQYFTFLPYLGFAIRHPETSTRWASGFFDKSRNYYIKYPSEMKATIRSQLILKSQEDWFKFLNKKRYLRFLIYKIRGFIFKNRLPVRIYFRIAFIKLKRRIETA